MSDSLNRFRDSTLGRRASALLARSSTRWLLVALAAGFVLFLLMWSQTRKQFYTVEPVAKGDSGPEYAPLPMPSPGDVLTAPDAAPDNSPNRPRLIEPPKPPPVAKAAPTDEAVSPAGAPASAAGTNVANAPASAPVPISQPPPAYPRAAMQMSREGKVRVRVDIGADGVPTDASVVESSGDRNLDRAAMEGVRRWRFKPAMAHGAPVAGTATVPIEFRLNQ